MSRSRVFGVSVVVALLAATLLSRHLIGGSLWPLPPEITAGPILNEDPYSLRYAVTNRSAVFTLNQVMLGCEIPRYVTRVATSVNLKASSFGDPVSIRPLETIEVRCPVNRNIRIGAAPVVYTTTVVNATFETLGIPRAAKSGSFHWTAEARQWRAGEYAR